MHGADEGALAATDHPPAQRSHLARPSVLSATELSPPAAKSSNAFSVTLMMWRLMNGAPSRAPTSGCLSAHSHSSTAQPSKSYAANFEKMPTKSTWPSPSERNRPERFAQLA